MIIEDNQLHQMAFAPLEQIRDASIYVNPTYSDKGPSVGRIMRKCYSSPEQALASIDEALIYGHHLPNVIVTDIELGRSHINGITLAKELDRMLKEAGRREELEIVVVYSSNIPLYEETIQGLISEGIVDDRRHKVDFKLHDLVETLEAKRAKGK